MDRIVSIFDPSVVLDEISVGDYEFGTDPNYQPTGAEPKLSKLAGNISPFIVINGMKFAYHTIEYMEIDLFDFLPQLTLVLKEKGGLFASKSYPKDGDLVSVYIRSETSTDWKPIRQDYRITDISSTPSKDPEGQSNTFTISAIINLPDIFMDKIKSFPALSSADTFQSIARELKLGYATNETNLNDIMTRICPYTSYYDFMLNDVLPSTYKDDNSFFTAFIDQYYYLNLIQVNDMIVSDRQLDQGKLNHLMSSDSQPFDTNTIKSEMKDLYLSNSRLMAGTPNYITGFAPINNSGNISMRDGYRTYLQYYDKSASDFVEYFIETMNTADSKDKLILKGRKDEDHTKYSKLVNLKYQLNENVHQNYLHSKLQNKYNAQEIKKLNLMVNLNGVNPILYRYQPVPVVLVTSQGIDMKKTATQDKTQGSSQDQFSYDKFMSGWYVVSGIKYIYGKSVGYFYTQILLARREFDLPV